MPRTLAGEVTAARSQILELVAEVRRRRAAEDLAADQALVQDADPRIAEALRAGDFRRAVDTLRDVVRTLTTDSVRDTVQARLARLRDLSAFYRRLTPRSAFEPFEFALYPGNPPVRIVRFRDDAVEYFPDVHARRARLEEWKNVRGETFVALLRRLARNEDERRACDALAAEFGITETTGENAAGAEQ